MSKLKVGMVGIGRATAYGRIFSEHPLTEVTALCDFNEEKLAQSAKDFQLPENQVFTRYDDFLTADIDIVVLGTPMPYHAEQVVKALAADKHVLSEVTVASTLEGCRQVYEAVQKSNKKYMLAENCCYMHSLMEWKRIREEGRLGDVYYAEADYVHEIRNLIIDAETGEERWRVDRAPLHYCSHSLGPILQLLDEDDYIVRCTASGKDATIIPHKGDGFIDMQVGLFQTKKGVTIKVLRSSVATRKTPLSAYSVYGTKGCLESGRTTYVNTGLRYIEGEDEKCVPMEFTYTDPNAPEYANLGGHGTTEFYLINDFLDCIINDTKPPIDIVRALDMSVPGLIAHEAAMEGGVWKDVPVFWR